MREFLPLFPFATVVQLAATTFAGSLTFAGLILAVQRRASESDLDESVPIVSLIRPAIDRWCYWLISRVVPACTVVLLFSLTVCFFQGEGVNGKMGQHVGQCKRLAVLGSLGIWVMILLGLVPLIAHVRMILRPDLETPAE